MKGTLLIEFRRKPMVDPYELKGQQKSEQLNYLFEIQENFDLLSNPTKQDKERYHLSCLWLEAEARRREKQFHYSAEMYGKKKLVIVEEAIAEFKTKLKMDFMTKYQDQIKINKFTPEMMKDMDKLSKIEKAACYRVRGINISLADCNTCEHKACR